MLGDLQVGERGQARLRPSVADKRYMTNSLDLLETSLAQITLNYLNTSYILLCFKVMKAIKVICDILSQPSP